MLDSGAAQQWIRSKHQHVDFYPNVGAQMDPFEYYRPLSLARHYVRSSIASQLTLEEVAAAAEQSKWHFSRTFRQRTGMRFQDWLAQERINYATGLLSRNNMTITQVAFASGFGSVSAFERAFKKFRSTTPCAYRHSKRVAIAIECQQKPTKQQQAPSNVKSDSS